MVFERGQCQPRRKVVLNGPWPQWRVSEVQTRDIGKQHLWPILFGQSSCANHLSPATSCQSSLASHLWPVIFGQSSFASHLWPGIHGESTLASHLWPFVFGQSSVASHLWPVICGESSLASHLWPFVFGQSSLICQSCFASHLLVLPVIFGQSSLFCLVDIKKRSFLTACVFRVLV